MTDSVPPKRAHGHVLDHVLASSPLSRFTCPRGHSLPLMRAHARSGPRVADQRFLLAAEYKEKNAEKAQNATAWRCQNGHHQWVPQVASGIGLDRRLELRQAAGVEQLPQRAHIGEKDHVPGD